MMKYLQYVNIKQGTDSLPRYSNGNTLPLVQAPFGMAAFAPQTCSDQGGFYFHPRHRWVEGVRLTHQPSPWIGDFGAFVLMPQEGKPQALPDNRVSSYRPEEAVFRPDYLKIRFERYRAVMELAPTERGCVLNLEYQGRGTPRFAVLPWGGECHYSLDAEKRMLTGYTRQHTWPMIDSFAGYFAISFDCEIDREESFLTDAQGNCHRMDSGTGQMYGYSVALKEKKVGIKLAISYISREQAIRNLTQELEGRSFEEVREKAAADWEGYLSRIRITAEEEKMRTFYSCLYRMFLFPNKFHEIDEDGRIVHFNTADGTVREGVCYTNNGFWDTCRTVYPMYALIAPEIYREILQGYVNTYHDSGWLPKWPSGSETGVMPGTLIDAVIGHAAATGVVEDELLQDAYQGALKHVFEQSECSRCGRSGTEEYRKYGYIPRDLYPESVNHTLDYVYGDFCLAQAAHKLGDTENEALLLASAKNYQKLFDPVSGLMRGRDCHGRMAETFDPCDWGGEYCEGGAWQNSFAVYHDPEGLAELYGGKEQMLAKIDELFATAPDYNGGGYDRMIHEMAEMAAADFGQCAISNQPSFHIPYLYSALGVREKTAYWVERMVNEAFSSGEDGFPGDEDNGSTSGWYLFSVMGFYPLCPSKAEYIKGKMLVDSLEICGCPIDPEDFPGDRINHKDLIKKIFG